MGTGSLDFRAVNGGNWGAELVLGRRGKEDAQKRRVRMCARV